MSILQNIPTPSFEFNAGLVDNRGALALVRQGQDITGQVAFPFVRNGVKNVPDKLGILRAVPANEPAVTFDGQGRNLGYLPESARTNLLKYSEDFNAGASWNRTDITVESTAVPFNSSLNFQKINFNAANANVRQTYAVISSLITQSVFVKDDGTSSTFNLRARNNVNTWSIIFKFTDGVLEHISTEGAGSPSFTIKELPNGIYRISASGITQEATQSIRIQGNADNSILAMAAQLEEGSFASTYIKTTDATVTRPADILTFTNASDLIGQTEGVIYAEVDLTKLLGNVARILIDIHDGSASNRLAIIFTAAATNTLRFLGTGISNIDQQLSSTGTLRLLYKVKNGDNKAFLNGSLIGQTSGNFTGSGLNTISIGQNFQDERQFDDPIRSVRLWKTADWCDDATAKLLTRI
jgi:hypothetical protein